MIFNELNYRTVPNLELIEDSKIQKLEYGNYVRIRWSKHTNQYYSNVNTEYGYLMDHFNDPKELIYCQFNCDQNILSQVFQIVPYSQYSYNQTINLLNSKNDDQFSWQKDLKIRHVLTGKYLTVSKDQELSLTDDEEVSLILQQKQFINNQDSCPLDSQLTLQIRDSDQNNLSVNFQYQEQIQHDLRRIQHYLFQNQDFVQLTDALDIKKMSQDQNMELHLKKQIEQALKQYQDRKSNFEMYKNQQMFPDFIDQQENYNQQDLGLFNIKSQSNKQLGSKFMIEKVDDQKIIELLQIIQHLFHIDNLVKKPKIFKILTLYVINKDQSEYAIQLRNKQKLYMIELENCSRSIQSLIIWMVGNNNQYLQRSRQKILYQLNLIDQMMILLYFLYLNNCLNMNFKDYMNKISDNTKIKFEQLVEGIISLLQILCHEQKLISQQLMKWYYVFKVILCDEGGIDTKFNLNSIIQQIFQNSKVNQASLSQINQIASQIDSQNLNFNQYNLLLTFCTKQYHSKYHYYEQIFEIIFQKYGKNIFGNKRLDLINDDEPDQYFQMSLRLMSELSKWNPQKAIPYIEKYMSKTDCYKQSNNQKISDIMIRVYYKELSINSWLMNDLSQLNDLDLNISIISKDKDLNIFYIGYESQSLQEKRKDILLFYNRKSIEECLKDNDIFTNTSIQKQKYQCLVIKLFILMYQKGLFIDMIHQNYDEFCKIKKSIIDKLINCSKYAKNQQYMQNFQNIQNANKLAIQINYSEIFYNIIHLAVLFEQLEYRRKIENEFRLSIDTFLSFLDLKYQRYDPDSLIFLLSFQNTRISEKVIELLIIQYNYSKINGEVKDNYQIFDNNFHQSIIQQIDILNNSVQNLKNSKSKQIDYQIINKQLKQIKNILQSPQNQQNQLKAIIYHKVSHKDDECDTFLDNQQSDILFHDNLSLLKKQELLKLFKLHLTIESIFEQAIFDHQQIQSESQLIETNNLITISLEFLRLFSDKNLQNTELVLKNKYFIQILNINDIQIRNYSYILIQSLFNNKYGKNSQKNNNNYQIHFHEIILEIFRHFKNNIKDDYRFSFLSLLLIQNIIKTGRGYNFSVYLNSIFDDNFQEYLLQLINDSDSAMKLFQNDDSNEEIEMPLNICLIKEILSFLRQIPLTYGQTVIHQLRNIFTVEQYQTLIDKTQWYSIKLEMMLLFQKIFIENTYGIKSNERSQVINFIFHYLPELLGEELNNYEKLQSQKQLVIHKNTIKDFIIQQSFLKEFIYRQIYYIEQKDFIMFGIIKLIEQFFQNDETMTNFWLSKIINKQNNDFNNIKIRQEYQENAILLIEHLKSIYDYYKVEKEDDNQFDIPSLKQIQYQEVRPKNYLSLYKYNNFESTNTTDRQYDDENIDQISNGNDLINSINLICKKTLTNYQIKENANQGNQYGIEIINKITQLYNSRSVNDQQPNDNNNSKSEEIIYSNDYNQQNEKYNEIVNFLNNYFKDINNYDPNLLKLAYQSLDFIILSDEIGFQLKQKVSLLMKILQNQIPNIQIQSQDILVNQVKYATSQIINENNINSKLQNIINFTQKISINLNQNQDVFQLNQQAFHQFLIDDKNDLFLKEMKRLIDLNFQDLNCASLQLLTVLCENHFCQIQNFIRSGNTGTVNLILHVTNQIILLVKFVDENNALFITKMIEFLIESVQGPCLGNQLEIFQSPGLIKILEEMMNIITQQLSQIDPLDIEQKLQDTNIRFLRQKIIELFIELIEENEMNEQQKICSQINIKILIGLIKNIYYNLTNLIQEIEVYINSIFKDPKLDRFSKLREIRNLYMQEGCQIYKLIQKITDHNPSIKPLLKEIAFDILPFFKQQINTIEVRNRNNVNIKQYFIIPNEMKYLTIETRQNFLDNVPRESAEIKIKSLITYIEIFQIEIDYFKDKKFTEFYNYFTLKIRQLAIVLNIVLNSLLIDKKNDGQIIYWLQLILIVYYHILFMTWYFSVHDLQYQIHIFKQKKNKTNSFREIFQKYADDFKKRSLSKKFKFFGFPSITKLIFTVLFSQSGFFVKFYQYFMNTDTLYYLTLLAFNYLGYFLNELFYSFLLLDMISYSITMQNVIKSVTQNIQQLFSAAILAIVVLYIYATLAYYPGKNYNSWQTIMYSSSATDETTANQYENCLGLLNCFIFMLHGGLRAGGGIGDDLIALNPHEQYYNYRVIYDITFFLLINVLFLNIVFGIVIDSFAELRDERNQKVNDIQNVCFICNIQRSDLENNGDSFENHTTKVHNIWYYVGFLVHLKEKQNKDFSGIETYINDKVQNQDYSWIPRFQPNNNDE